MFFSFAKENKKNVVQVERACYGIIPDTIEWCFAFDMESDNYELEIELATDIIYSDALSRAI